MTKKFVMKKVTLRNRIHEILHTTHAFIVPEVIPLPRRIELTRIPIKEELNAGDITSLFKQEGAFSKKNYLTITVLPSITKIFERLMQNQMLPFIQNVLSPLLHMVLDRAMAHSMHFYVLQKPSTTLKTVDGSQGLF